jgi:hypothetical protein
MSFIFAALAAILLLSSGYAASGTLTVAPEFQSPTPLPAPVSLTGWEDSAQITLDGKRLYFTYFRIDPIFLIALGQIRLGETRTGWPTQPYAAYGSELYRSTNVNGVWQVPQNLGTKINLPEDAEGDVWVSEDDQRILYTNGDGSPARPSGIYYASKVAGVWGTPVLASSIGFPFVLGDENPHLTRDEQTLFFESRRPGGFGVQDIWMSRKINGLWQAPVNLGPIVNTSGIEGSPFSIDGSVLYFDDKGSGGGIFRCRRQTDGTYAQRELVMGGYAGDPSLDLAGNLYFVDGWALVDAQQKIVGFESNLAVAKRR